MFFMAAIEVVCVAFFFFQPAVPRNLLLFVVFLGSSGLLELQMYYFGWQSTECRYSQEESIKRNHVFIFILPAE